MKKMRKIIFSLFKKHPKYYSFELHASNKPSFLQLLFESVVFYSNTFRTPIKILGSSFITHMSLNILEIYDAYTKSPYVDFTFKGKLCNPVKYSRNRKLYGRRN